MRKLRWSLPILAAILCSQAPSPQDPAKPAKPKKPTRQFYELRTYVLGEDGDHSLIDAYLSKALIPALGRLGAGPVGVFTEAGTPKPLKKPRPPMMHVLITYPRPGVWLSSEAKLSRDQAYKDAAKPYLRTPKNKPAYARIKSRVFRAFAAFPQIKVGDTSSDRVFEMRTYDSYSEAKHKLKVEMFNRHELGVFDNVGFRSVWYGQALAGENLPSLTYMLRYRDLEERTQQWQKFRADPGWLELKGRKRYANTVSAIESVYLKPTSYSQL